MADANRVITRAPMMLLATYAQIFPGAGNVLISDLGLPDGNGIDLIQKLASKPPPWNLLSPVLAWNRTSAEGRTKVCEPDDAASTTRKTVRNLRMAGLKTYSLWSTGCQCRQAAQAKAKNN